MAPVVAERPVAGLHEKELAPVAVSAVPEPRHIEVVPVTEMTGV